jgi:hypothetical protein
MVHLSNPTTIGIMIFYSLLTFFIGPLITKPLFQGRPYHDVAGFVLGFVVSVILWLKYGKKYAT